MRFARQSGNSVIPKGWEPYVAVQSGRQFKSHTIDQIYTTRKEAETAGIAFAKKWIDEGMPDINPRPSLLTSAEIVRALD